MAIAAWIGSLSTLGLLVAAILGFRVWKKQFFGQRDHDLALKVLRHLHLSSQELQAFRSPVTTIMDGDVPIEPSAFADPNLDYDYRRMWARYKSRRNHMFDRAEARINIVHDARVVWPDFRESLDELGSKLTDVEVRVVGEARKYVESLLPGVNEPEEFDRDILYANRDGEDAIDDEYTEIVGNFRDLLAPKIHML